MNSTYRKEKEIAQETAGKIFRECYLYFGSVRSDQRDDRMLKLIASEILKLTEKHKRETQTCTTS